MNSCKTCKDRKKVIVCDDCLSLSCAEGNIFCENYRNAGFKEVPCPDCAKKKTPPKGKTPTVKESECKVPYSSSTTDHMLKCGKGCPITKMLPGGIVPDPQPNSLEERKPEDILSEMLSGKHDSRYALEEILTWKSAEVKRVLENLKSHAADIDMDNGGAVWADVESIKAIPVEAIDQLIQEEK